MANLKLQNFPNALNDMPLKRKIGGADVESFAYKCVPQRRVTVTQNFSTSTPTNVLSGWQGDARIENCVDVIKQVFLRIQYQNNSGGAIQISPSSNLLKQIQLFSENFSNLLYQTIDVQEEFLIDSVSISRNEYELIAPYILSDANYATGPVTIANGQSGYFDIHICPSFWKATMLRPYTIQGNLGVRVLFNTTAACVVGGVIPSGFTTPECVLRITGYYEPPQQIKTLTDNAMVPKNFFYLAPQMHQESLTLNPSQQYTIRLSAIMGAVSQIYFTLRSQAYVQDVTNWANFVRCDRFELLDSSQQALTGYNPIEISDMIIAYAHQYDNLFIAHTGASVWSFSQCPVKDNSLGTLEGFSNFDGFNSIRITTPASLAPGGYQLTLVAMCSENLRINKARVTSTRT